jgi:transcriptional regulator with XRE-family HTH domain
MIVLRLLLRRLLVQLRIEELRKRNFLTLQELADRSGVTISTLSRIENGLQDPRPSTVRKIAAALGIEPQELLVEEAEKKTSAV